MKISIMKVLVIILFITGVSLSQSAAFDTYNTSRFARTIRLGNVYTGVAEGPEALFYNAAGIANQNSYNFIFSSGQGVGFLFGEIRAYDYAIIMPFSKEYGTLGFSVNTLTFDFDHFDSETENNIYSMTYARILFDDFSVGISLSYYSYEESFTDLEVLNSVTGSAIDINLSSLYKLPANLTFSENDIFQVGLQIKNLLNTKVKYDDYLQSDYKLQNIRFGLSYTYIPNMQSIFKLSPLKFMFAVDAVFMGSEYEFPEWQPNFGLELTLLELLQLSFGRENELQIKQTYSYTPQYPVNRYGFGIKIPFHKLFNLSYKMELKFDYSISDWQKIDEESGTSQFFRKEGGVENKAFSVGLNLGL